VNYFEILGLKEAYSINLEELDKSYFAMQRELLTNQGLTYSYSITQADLNKAYSTIKSELQRALYMLSLKDIDINDPKMRNVQTKEELEQIWAEREELESASSIESLKCLLEAKNNERTSLIKKLENAFAKNQLKESIDLTVRLKYLTNLISEIKTRNHK